MTRERGFRPRSSASAAPILGAPPVPAPPQIPPVIAPRRRMCYRWNNDFHASERYFGSFSSRGAMDVRNRFWIPVVVLSALSFSFMKAGGPEPAKIQVVYESDTRGYYLPCG